MPVIHIYDKYKPSAADRTAKREELAQQIVDMFAGYCTELNALNADEVIQPIASGSNPHIWNRWNKNPAPFETLTKLALFEGSLMTVKKRDEILASRVIPDPVPPPAPATGVQAVNPFELGAPPAELKNAFEPGSPDAVTVPASELHTKNDTVPHAKKHR